MITVPMEQDLLAGVAWLDVIRSESVPGLSSVVVLFEPGTDLYQARQMVSERLAQAAVGLPHVSKPPTMIQPQSSASRFLLIGLSSKELSLIEMSVLARWTIGPRLMGVPGVANVAIWGNRDRQLQVLVDPQRLQAQGVTLDQVVETAGNALWVSSLSYLEASSPGTGGFIDTPNQRLGIWHVLPISSPEELAQVPIDGTESLILSDVANVVEDHQPLIGDAVVNDQPNLLLVVEKLPGMNTLEVTRNVEAALDALRPGFEAIDFDATLFRPATFIETAIANLTRSLVIAAVLIILVLGAFFYGWRTALISLVAILFSLVTALWVLYLRGATLNAMVLAGLVIALSIVIDEAVVDVDQIVKRLRQNRSQASPQSPESIILETAVEMRSTLLFAMLITLLAVVPAFFIEGMSAALFQPLAISYVLAVLAAMVVALTITPALSAIFLASSRLEHRESPLSRWLQRGYENNLAKTIRKPRLVLVSVVVLIVAGIAVLPFLRQEQTNLSFKESYLLIQVEGAPATSRPAMNRIVARMSSELRAIPGIQNVGANVGRAVFGDQVVGINSAQLWVKIDPKADYDATVTAVQELADGYTGIDMQVQTYIDQMLDRSSVKADETMTLRVFGEDQDVLRSQAANLQQAINGIDGVVDAYVDLPVYEPTLEIEVDLPVAQKYGIKPGDVRRAAAILLSGIQVGSLFEEQKIFDVVVWSTPETRDSLSDIGELMIDAPDGTQVRLSELANVNMVASPTVIRREAVSPYLDVLFDVKGRNPKAVAGDIEALIQDYPLPLEYHAEVLGTYAAQQTIQQHILIALIIAVIGIFLLLQASLGNWPLAFMTFLSLPVILVGGVLAAFLTSGTLSPLSIFGLLAILIMGVRNSLLLSNQYQHLEKKEGEAFGQELVLRGARERVAPALLSALATGLALLPFIILGNIPGHEIIRPLAIVILGGLITAIWWNLFVMPSIYLRFGASQEADLGFLPIPEAE
jgi:Cu/Ag efflux pump CusA